MNEMISALLEQARARLPMHTAVVSDTAIDSEVTLTFITLDLGDTEQVRFEIQEQKYPIKQTVVYVDMEAGNDVSSTVFVDPKLEAAAQLIAWVWIRLLRIRVDKAAAIH